MSVSQIENKMREIEQVLKLISDSLPMGVDRVAIVFNKLTSCSIDLYSYVEELGVAELRDDIDILALLIDSIIECGDTEFRATLKTIEINDKEKGISIVTNMKVLDIRPEW